MIVKVKELHLVTNEIYANGNNSLIVKSFYIIKNENKNLQLAKSNSEVMNNVQYSSSSH